MMDNEKLIEHLVSCLRSHSVLIFSALQRNHTAGPDELDAIADAMENAQHEAAALRATIDKMRGQLEAVTREKEATNAVRAVRCKDCKHWHDSAGWCDKLSFFELDGEPCSPAESQSWKMFEDDDFCSYGERKEAT